MRDGFSRLVMPLISRLRAIFAGTRHVVRLWRANKVFLTPALQRAGLLEPSRQDVLTRLYQIYWYVGFVVVLVLPSYPQEPFFVFPALLALAIAWLVAMPQLGQTFLTIDMSILRAPQGTLQSFVSAVRGAGIKLPAEADNPELARQVDAVWHELGPEYVRAGLMHIAKWLGFRFAYLGTVGMVGLFVGPALASVHVGWLRGWSPVSILYAVAAPVALFVLVALLVPVFVFAFLSGIQADIRTTEYAARHNDQLPRQQAEPPSD